jgi:hypothetical protein
LNKRYDTEFGLKEKWSIKLVDFIDEDADAEQLKNMFYNIFTFKKYIEKTQKGVII